MLLPMNTMVDCSTLKSRDSDLYIDTKQDLFSYKNKTSRN